MQTNDWKTNTCELCGKHCLSPKCNECDGRGIDVLANNPDDSGKDGVCVACRGQNHDCQSC